MKKRRVALFLHCFVDAGGKKADVVTRAKVKKFRLLECTINEIQTRFVRTTVSTYD